MRVLLSGLIAGLAGALVLATLFTVATPTSPGLPMRSLMHLLAGATGSGRLVVGWAITVAVGVLFGLAAAFAARRARTAALVPGMALVLGGALWLVMVLVAVPVLFDVSPVAVATTPVLWPVALFLGVACLLFGSAVGAVLGAMSSPLGRDERHEPRTLRRAA